MFTIPIQLRFNDVDVMGHVNNAVIMEFFDLGKSQYFAAAGVPVRPDEDDFCVMIVHYEVDFLSQIRYGDEVEVCTQVVRWGNKSFEVRQQVTANGTPAVICKTVMAGYSRKAGAAATIPDEVKERVRQYDATH